jgi:Sigma-70, region 4
MVMKYMLVMRATDEAFASMADADFSEMLEIVGKFNDELIRAGVLLAAEGLADAAEGVVVDFSSELLADRVRADRRRARPVRRGLRAGGTTSGRLPVGPAQNGPDLLWDPDQIDDDVLALMFISCHPMLSREARVALTLRVVGGLTSDEIARAFLVPAATIQARITRAKKSLGAARPCQRGAAPRPGAGAADPRRARGARPACAPGADRRPFPRPHRPGRRARSPGAAEPRPVGPPVVDLNRAVVVAMAQGPTAALPIVDQLLAAGAMPGSHLLPSVRGELLTRLGRYDEARAELKHAVALCGNERERAVLGRKITDIADQG